MTMTTTTYTEHQSAVAATELYYLQGGTGNPMLILHGIEGHEGWLPFHEALAVNSSVYVPAHPGFAQTPCPAWLETIAHQAVFYQWFLQQEGLRNVDLIGLGLGGWIAAHMAIMCTHHLRRLILVDAAGLRPQQGEILDIFVLPWRQVIERCFYAPDQCPEYQRVYGDDFQEFGGLREAGRTMSIRMGFRPFLYDPAFAGMLGKISLPTLVVWGAHDQIIPVECGRLFQQLIPQATLHLIDQASHWPHYERPQELAEVIGQFLAQPS